MFEIHETGKPEKYYFSLKAGDIEIVSPNLHDSRELCEAAIEKIKQELSSAKVSASKSSFKTKLKRFFTDGKK